MRGVVLPTSCVCNIQPVHVTRLTSLRLTKTAIVCRALEQTCAALLSASRPALQLLDVMASYPGSDAREAVRKALLPDDAEDELVLLAPLVAVLAAPGHNVRDCAAALNLLWIVVLGES